MSPTPATQIAPPPRRAGPRVALWLLVILLLTWSIGFVRFVDTVAREEPAGEQKADAIVVLTGGAQRVGAGFRLLREGRAERLFVSGVNENVRASDLHAMAVVHQTAKPGDVPRCCVELGFQAQDTRGNAAEIEEWVRANGVRSLIVITSNYHLARALLEVRAVLPEIEIHPHPVVARTVMLRSWWRWPGTLLLLASEYQKLMLVGFRVLIQGRA